MPFINILLAIPVAFYISIALFLVSVVVQLKLAGNRDQYAESGANQTGEAARNRDIEADLSLAGVIAFGLLVIYFSWSVIMDWRESRGIFYPEDRISADNIPVDMSQNLPPAPPALEGEKK